MNNEAFEVSQFDLLKALECARELITMCDKNTALKRRDEGELSAIKLPCGLLCQFK